MQWDGHLDNLSSELKEPRSVKKRLFNSQSPGNRLLKRPYIWYHLVVDLLWIIIFHCTCNEGRCRTTQRLGPSSRRTIRKLLRESPFHMHTGYYLACHSATMVVFQVCQRLPVHQLIWSCSQRTKYSALSKEILRVQPAETTAAAKRRTFGH